MSAKPAEIAAADANVTDRRKPRVEERTRTFCPPLKYKIISDGEINLTKAAAYRYLELERFQGEREVRERHVQFLFDEWKSNRFLWQNVIIASAKISGGDTEFRINGQHTCWMRVQVNERYEPLDCRVRSMVYQVQNQEQLRTLYSVFDRGAPRSVNHIGKVILSGTAAADGVQTNILSLLISAFKIFWNPESKSAELARRVPLSMNDWCGIIDNNYSVIFNTVGRWASSRGVQSNSWAKRAAVVAAMFFTFEKELEAADEFWGRVMDGVNLTTKGDPRWQLRNYLMTHGHSLASGLEKVGQEDMLRVCLNLWNHWRDGQQVTVVKNINERPKAK
jgi:hypothetical protein